MAHCSQPKPAAPCPPKPNDCHQVQKPKPTFFKTPQPAVYQPKPQCPPSDHYLVVTEDQIMNFLEKYDVNRDGLLDKCELTKSFEDLGAFFPGWRTGRALAVADKNCDGQVCLDELDDVLIYAKKSGYKIC